MLQHSVQPVLLNHLLLCTLLLSCGFHHRHSPASMVEAACHFAKDICAFLHNVDALPKQKEHNASRSPQYA